MSNNDIMTILFYLERVTPRGNEEEQQLYKLIQKLKRLMQ